MTTPRVAIIIVNYNGATYLKELAESLRHVTYPNYKLWLVDNASPDGSGAMLQRLFPDAAVILNQRNLGFGGANNQALARCLDGDTDYVLLLNPDTTHAPDFLDQLVESADQRTLVAPKVIDARTGLLANHAGGYSWLRARLFDTHDDEPDGPALGRPREVEVTSFACTLIPAEAFRAAGVFDERFGMYLEDTDLSIRMRRAGFRILVQPAAVIRHRQGASSGRNRSVLIEYYATRNRPYLIGKHFGGLRYAAFSAYFISTVTAKVLVRLLHRDWGFFRARYLALRDGYTGRLGMPYQPDDFATWSRPPRLLRWLGARRP